jgi:hypothetical protein
VTKTARRLAGGVALLCGCLAGTVHGADLPIAAAPHIDAIRLQSNLEHLAQIGRDPGGGITRLGLSQAELDAHSYAADLMPCRTAARTTARSARSAR